MLPVTPIPGAHNSGTATSAHPGVIPSPGQFRTQMKSELTSSLSVRTQEREV